MLSLYCYEMVVVKKDCCSFTPTSLNFRKSVTSTKLKTNPSAISSKVWVIVRINGHVWLVTIGARVPRPMKTPAKYKTNRHFSDL